MKCEAQATRRVMFRIPDWTCADLGFICAAEIRGNGVFCCIYYWACISVMHWIATLLGSSMKAASLALLISRTIAFVHASSILPSYGVLVSMERWLMFQHTQEKGLRETG
jgi:hypothetical protein